MIVTEGGRFGGFGLYLLKGKPVFVYNLLGIEQFRWEGQALAPGKHTIVFDFTYDGPGFGEGWYRRPQGGREGGRDQEDAAQHSLPLDDRRDLRRRCRHAAPRSTTDYQVPFRFTGKLDKVTVDLKDLQLASKDQQLREEKVGAGARLDDHASGISAR